MSLASFVQLPQPLGSNEEGSFGCCVSHPVLLQTTDELEPNQRVLGLLAEAAVLRELWLKGIKEQVQVCLQVGNVMNPGLFLWHAQDTWTIPGLPERR